MDDINGIIGNNEICKGMCNLLLKIIKERVRELPKVNNEGETTLYINK